MTKIAALLLLLFSLSVPLAAAQEKWKGIDETVVQKYAADRGVEASEPFLSVEGDLLLFLFALGGAIGGFVMGYYWHKVMVAGRADRDRKE